MSDTEFVLSKQTRVAVIGGTGPQGRGLALRWAHAGMSVRIGSRDLENAQRTATEVRALVPDANIEGATNQSAADWANIVAIVVPWSGHEATIKSLREELRGKLVIDCVNPLAFDKQGAYALVVPEGSATEQAANLLPESRVVGAFHNVSAVLLNDLSHSIDCDVLVLSDRRADAQIVQDLADLIPGARGVYGGRLRNCAQIEALTANLITINRRYKVHSGVRISGLPVD